MTDYLNNFDMLDPTEELHKIDAKLGGGIFDKWSDLDPALAAARINSKIAGVIDNASLLDPYRAVQRLNAAGSGGGGSYIAKAVHFDGSTWLDNTSLTATDSGFCSYVIWIKATINSTGLLFIVDPNGEYINDLGVTINSDGAIQQMDCDFYDGVSSSNSHIGVGPNNGTDPPIIGTTWICLITSVNTGVSPKVGCTYIGDVNVTHNNEADSADTYNLTFNGLEFTFGSDTQGTSYTGDIADARVMPGITLLNGDGDIPEATRRLFIDASGKPVDPTVATAALGSSAVLFSGDETTFANNKGTGGTFIVTGTLTNASTSPSD